MKIKSFSSENTQQLGFMVGKEAKPGDVICLIGSLGAGKTVFAQGFCRALEYEGRVTSPTFNIMNTYEGGRFPIYHFDLYRLENDLESIGYEDYFFGQGVSLVEWPEKAMEAIPEGAIWLEITAPPSDSDDYREIILL